MQMIEDLLEDLQAAKAMEEANKVQAVAPGNRMSQQFHWVLAIIPGSLVHIVAEYTVRLHVTD